MAQTLTLEEAAASLGLPVAEFKRRIQMEWKHVRSFRDGGTLRFQSNVIEELGRGMGLSSDSELQFDAGKGSSTEHLSFPSSDDSLLLPESMTGTQLHIDLPAPVKNVPLFSTSPTMDLPPLAVNNVSPKPAKPTKTPGKPLSSEELILAIDSSDSFDVLPMESELPKRPTAPVFSAKSATDSDIRLEGDAPRRPATRKPADDEDALLTDEIDLDMPQFKSGVLKAGDGPRSSRASKAPPAGLSSSSIKKPQANEDSNFELSLDADSSAEFEISIADDLPPVKGRGDQATRSGVNLGKPADSGLNLDRKKKPKFIASDSDESIDFEISLDAPGMGGISGMSGKNIGGRSSRNIMDSDSEFEISLDDLSAEDDIRSDTSSISQSSRKGIASEDQDIFETDFNLLADESGSEVQDLVGTDSESSEFDLELDGDVSADESASVAVEVDDDSDLVSDADGGISFDDMELEEGGSASGALRGINLEEEADTYDSGRPVRTEPVYIEKKSAPWGAVPAIMLIPAFFIIFVGGLMGFEMIRGSSGYEQSGRPSAVLLDNISGALGVKADK